MNVVVGKSESTFGTAGRVTAANWRSAAGVLSTLVNSITYAPTGAPTFVHAVTGVDTTYTYDKNGNQLTDGTFTNTWDFKNRLITSAKAGNTVSYAYNHLGNRVKKTDTAVAVPTYYVTPEYEIEGADIRHHVIAPGLGNIVTIITGGAFIKYRYHLTDHLGGTHVETDGAGTIVYL
jgi:YD repeat-containing protein